MAVSVRAPGTPSSESFAVTSIAKVVSSSFAVAVSLVTTGAKLNVTVLSVGAKSAPSNTPSPSVSLTNGFEPAVNSSASERPSLSSSSSATLSPSPSLSVSMLSEASNGKASAISSTLSLSSSVSHASPSVSPSVLV